MELFTLNRYDEEVLPDDPDKEDKALQKLISKAEKRKRKLIKSQLNGTNVSSSDSVTENVPQDDSKNNVKKMKTEDEQDKMEIENDNHILDQQNNQIDAVDSNLKVLGDDIFQKKQKVDMVLPPWLAHPTIITNKISDADENNSIETLKFLSPNIKEALKDMKIEKLFPVQNAVIPWILNAHSKPSPFRPRDICVSAPTGSGKTLAFAIPIVQILTHRVECKIRALIVLPVNELALQVYRVFKTLTNKTDLTVCLLSKSLPLAVEQQNLIEYFNGNYYSKIDIIVTTPGRLVEHMHSTKGFNLTNLKFLVIDEADRIMEQIHHNWLYHLDNHVRDTSNTLLSGKSFYLCLNDLRNVAHQQPHKLLFSATLSQDPEKLQNLHLFQPKLFTSIVANPEELLKKLKENQKLSNENNENDEIRGEFIGKYTTPAELIEKYCITENHLKPLTLYSLIMENSWKKFLCFTNSVETAHRLTFVLGELFNDKNVVKEISSNLKLQERTKILNLFAIGAIRGLISSDGLARGIDIPKVDIVISYELPRHIKTYIHRVGRTARAGQSGTAITLLSEKELPAFNKTLSEGGKFNKMDEIKVISDIEVENAQQYSNILEQLKIMLEREKKIKIIYKDAITKKAIPSKTATNSIMERLQIQANELVANKLEIQMKKQKKFGKKMKKLKFTKK